MSHMFLTIKGFGKVRQWQVSLILYQLKIIWFPVLHQDHNMMQQTVWELELELELRVM